MLREMGKGMNESAVQAIKQWKFSPATKDGRPVAVMITVEMNFSIGISTYSTYNHPSPPKTSRLHARFPAACANLDSSSQEVVENRLCH